ncbi:MAG: ATP phosphoribosyltransferase regulatory subunit [Chloroflexi bacterium]|nr:ATP phosphoribosyltransferase regulatory subunit [Chloroflexota bacterium]
MTLRFSSNEGTLRVGHSKMKRQLAALPLGVRDILFAEAARRTDLQTGLRRLFEGWGYSEIVTPTFEYAQTMEIGAGPALLQEMYRFLDREGQLLALRSDITTSVARIVGTKLLDQPKPLRFYYIANVFRHEEPQAGRQREFYQAGVELIGSERPEADAEVVALTVRSLQVAGLNNFQLNLGHIGFFKGLTEDLALSPSEVGLVRAAIDRKDAGALRSLLLSLGIGERERRVLTELPCLCGRREIIEKAHSLAINPRSEQAIKNLAEIYEYLDDHGLVEHIIIDLGEVRGMEYYTGMMFEGFVQGLGFSVCSGGRYDDLIGRFGQHAPAVGFALGLERVLLALDKQNEKPPTAQVASEVLLSNHAGQRGLALAETLRGKGYRVEVEVLGRAKDELLTYAGQKGIKYVVQAGEVLKIWTSGRCISRDWMEVGEVEQWQA